MPVKYTPNRCVNSCQPVSKHFDDLIRRQEHSCPNKTAPLAWKKWSCPSFKKQNQNVTLKTSILQAENKEMVVLILIDFFVTVFKTMGCFYHFCFFQ